MHIFLSGGISSIRAINIFWAQDSFLNYINSLFLTFCAKNVLILPYCILMMSTKSIT